MTEQVLTDEEKNALLDGVQSGAVEVHTAAGQRYADVHPYEIPAASRIRSNSYPYLQVLNQQVADRLASLIDKTLNCQISVVTEEVSAGPFGHCVRAFDSPPAVIAYAAAPLEGRALLIIDAPTIGRLVEGFYGGANNDPSSSVVAFTPGEISVCRLFGNAVLSTVSEAWRPLVAFTPKAAAPIIGIDLVEDVSARDPVISSRFEIRFADGNGAFSLVWPADMIAGLLPVFEGQKRERDPAADARWQKALRARLPEAVVALEATVGHVMKQLGELTGLKPGDVIDIENPQTTHIAAGARVVLDGRFGVLAGRNAIEMTGWIEPESSD